MIFSLDAQSGGDIFSAIESLLLTNLSTVVAVASVVLLITVPILLDRWRHRREMSYRILSSEALRRGMPGLQVTFNNVAVPNPFLCTFKITNTGRVPISEREYSRDIEVAFAPCSHSTHSRAQPSVLAYELVELKPRNLPLRVAPNVGNLFVAPLLLNPSDSFTVRVLLSECFDEKVAVNARIEGIKSVKPPGESWIRSSWFEGVMIGFLLTFMVVVIANSQFGSVPIPVVVGVFSVITAGLLTSYIIELTSRRRLR